LPARPAPPEAPHDYATNILIADGVATFKSEACIRMAQGLGLPWLLVGVARVLPRPWRDRLYGILRICARTATNMPPRCSPRRSRLIAACRSGADGASERRAIARSSHMIAEGDEGALIPSMAAEAIIRRRLEGRRPAPGARAALCDLELTDYEALFTCRRIVSGVREAAEPTMPLYRRPSARPMRHCPVQSRPCTSSPIHSPSRAAPASSADWA
jgi:hypothetical protein